MHLLFGRSGQLPGDLPALLGTQVSVRVATPRNKDWQAPKAHPGPSLLTMQHWNDQALE